MCRARSQYARPEADHDDWWGNNGGAKWRAHQAPQHLVNFVTAHDGFSLADLVSYNDKHNEQNGEDNNDGENHNLSWNCGEEGLTSDARTERLRQRQLRNFASSLLVAQGVPMILMGDEYGHCKGGNNNTYCHDTALNYVDWAATNADERGLRRFWQHMIRLRKTWPELAQAHYLHANHVKWHGPAGGAPDWDTGRFLGMVLKASDDASNEIYVAFNTSHVPVMVSIPVPDAAAWRLVVDTSAVAPRDILIADDRLSEADVAVVQVQARRWLDEGSFPMMPWSCVILEARA